MVDVSKLGNFMLVNVAAQRARQLMQGAAPIVRTGSRKPAAIAIREVQSGLVPVFLPGELPDVPEEAEAADTEEEEEEGEETQAD